MTRALMFVLACCAAALASAADVRVAGPSPGGMQGATITLVPDGRILQYGGGAVQLWNPVTRAWEPDFAAAQSQPRRYFHTATLTADGRVVLVGGIDAPFQNTSQQSALASSVTWKPARNVWERGPGLLSPRVWHAAVALASNDVLVTGGATVTSGTAAFGPLLASVEQLGDNATTARQPLRIARAQHTATLLADGRVLVVGGIDTQGAPLAATEIYDPAADRWQAGPSLHAARARHVATALRDGRILVTGGVGDNGDNVRGVEVYDPKSDAWTRAGELAEPRAGHAATPLPNGDVLVSGGTTDAARPAESLELWSDAAQRWQHAGQLPLQLDHHHAAALPDGKVLLFGSDSYASASVFVWLANATENARVELTADATLLALRDGRLFVAGGQRRQSASSSVSLYDPARSQWLSARPMHWARNGHRALELRDGRVLVLGGDVAERPAPRGAPRVEPRTYPAEIWDPRSNEWTLSNSLQYQDGTRAEPALLPDGRVLLGGVDSRDSYSDVLQRYRIWDPRDDSLTGFDQVARAHPGGIALAYPDGHLLQLGGSDYPESAPDSRRLDAWDPMARSWRKLPSAALSLNGAQFIALDDGGVLAWRRAANADNSVEPFQRWSPQAGWQSIPLPPQLTGQQSIEAFPLPRGDLLVIVNSTRSWAWDAASHAWSGIAHEARWGQLFKVVTLGNGRTLAFRTEANRRGGFAPLEALWLNRSAHRWQPDAEGYYSRDLPAMVVLPGTRVLVAGGATSVTQVFDARSSHWSDAGFLPEPLERPVAMLLHDGAVMLAGLTLDDEPAVVCAAWRPPMPDAAATQDIAATTAAAPIAGWSECGRFPVTRDGARRALVLRYLDDERVLLVFGEQQALIRDRNGAWTPARMQMPQTLSVPAADPAGTPFLANLAAVWDPALQKWADATDVLFTNGIGMVPVRGGLPAEPRMLSNTRSYRWRSADRTLHADALKDPPADYELGGAAQLAPGCFAAWSNARQSRTAVAGGIGVRTLHVADVARGTWHANPDVLLDPYNASGIALDDGTLLLAGRAALDGRAGAGFQRLRVDCESIAALDAEPTMYLPVRKATPPPAAAGGGAGTAVSKGMGPGARASPWATALASAQELARNLRRHPQSGLLLGGLAVLLLLRIVRRWGQYVIDDAGVVHGRRIDAVVLVVALLLAAAALVVPWRGVRLATLCLFALLAIAAAWRLWHNIEDRRARWAWSVPFVAAAMALAMLAGSSLAQALQDFTRSLTE